MTAPTDPFLWAHGLTGHIFDIATGLRPSSVRDQVTRARLLIRRAWETKIFEPGSRIVISGAGIGGATCALEAVHKYGARVLLLEKEPFPFLLQRRCITRNVDPNLYDWPAAQWQKKVYPSQPGDSVHFTIEASEQPRNVARRWADSLNAAAADQLLEIRYCSHITKVHADLSAARTHTVEWYDDRAKSADQEQAAMVIFAEGPGEERDTLRSTMGSQFRGYRFWDTDPFTNDPIRARRIIIAGSGDGALQDFLRLLLKPRTPLRTLLDNCAIPEEHLASIQTCRQHNLAAFLWCAGYQHEHEIDLFVHEHHVAVIDALFASTARTRILEAVRAALRPKLPKLVLAHACAHFTHGHPLNRFLALLVHRAVHALGHHDIEFMPNTFVTAIDCQHKTIPCPEDEEHLAGEGHRRRVRRYCYAKPHKVYFGSGQCYDKPPAHMSSDREASFDAILLRLGVQEHVPIDFPRERGEKPLRQLLPSHLAHQR